MSNRKLSIPEEWRDLFTQARNVAYWWWSFTRGLAAGCLVLALASLFLRVSIWQPIVFFIALILTRFAFGFYGLAYHALRMDLFEREEGAALELIESVKRRSVWAPLGSPVGEFDLEEETQKALARVMARGKRWQRRGSLYLVLALLPVGYGYAMFIVPLIAQLLPIWVAWAIGNVLLAHYLFIRRLMCARCGRITVRWSHYLRAMLLVIPLSFLLPPSGTYYALMVQVGTHDVVYGIAYEIWTCRHCGSLNHPGFASSSAIPHNTDAAKMRQSDFTGA